MKRKNLRRRAPRLLSVLLALCLALSLLPVTAWGAEVLASTPSGPGTGSATGLDPKTTGTCGDNLTWTLDTDGTLTISGTGDMADYGIDNNYFNAPWFGQRYAITAVVIGNGVTSIGDYAFYICSSLTSLTIGDGVTSIGERAFSGCDSLTSLTIGDGVTSIGERAFSGCDSLSSVTIPDNVTSIGYGAFFDCSKLTSINVASGNTAYSSVDGVLFSADKTLLHSYPVGKTDKSYSIPASVITIGNQAFGGSRLGSVTIGGNVESIGEGAFCPCTSLTSVTIPDSVVSIGTSAFWGCSSLKSVTIPDSVAFIGDFAFESCRSLTSVTIPDSVTSIGYGAFDFCSSLTSATIGGGVTSIGLCAFMNAPNLTAINVKSGNPSYTSVDGVLFSADKTLLHSYPAGKSDTSYSIPTSVTTIEAYAFYGCSNLESVDIPDSVESIGDYAFYTCSSLTSVIIPVSVTSIGMGAFENCTSLTDVYYDGSESQWKQIEIDYRWNDPLLNATIHYNSAVSDPSTGGVTVSPKSLTLTVGKTGKLTVALSEEAKNAYDGFGWKSENPDVATVAWDGDGYDSATVSGIRKGMTSVSVYGIKDDTEILNISNDIKITVNSGSSGGGSFGGGSSGGGSSGGGSSGGSSSGGSSSGSGSSGGTGGTGSGSTTPSTPKVPDTTNTPWTNPFTDVSESDWFYDDVAYVVQNGLMVGVGNGQFNPGGTTTRGMIMTILARLDGADTSGGDPWYQPGMEWAMRAGVSDGTGPETDITREQFVTMLWRYAGEPAANGTLTAYPDSGNVSGWASSAMIWAVQNGIINGSDGKLNPLGNALRSEAAAMLTRYCNKIIK